MAIKLQVTRQVGRETISLQAELGPKDDAQQVFANLVGKLESLSKAAAVRAETVAKRAKRKGRMSPPKLRQSDSP